MKLSVAIVTYHPDLPMLRRVIDSVVLATQQAQQSWPALQVSLILIDNDPVMTTAQGMAVEVKQLPQRGFHDVAVMGERRNLGYGAGHNLCLAKLDSDVHLILNPDVILAEDFLTQGLRFLEEHSSVVALAPHARGEHGEPLYLCKRYPTVLDLWLRGFVPAALRWPYAKRLAHYQMQDVYENKIIDTNIPIISGCCMLIRTKTFRQLQGFDERFFLYFEDFDLSLRAAELGQVAYHPDMHIQHFGGFSARKGWWHIRQFAHSGRQFFDKHGWRWV